MNVKTMAAKCEKVEKLWGCQTPEMARQKAEEFITALSKFSTCQQISIKEFARKTGDLFIALWALEYYYEDIKLTERVMSEVEDVLNKVE